nr:translation initiation factor if-2, mitochondrial [Quercus suber]
MRGQRFIQTSSAQNVCIFCACRLSGLANNVGPPLLSGSVRRQLNTSSSLEQAPGAVRAEAASNGSGSAPPPAFAGSAERKDGAPTLSAWEQAERGRLRELREEWKQQQESAAVQRLKQAEEARKAWESKQAQDKKALEEARQKVLDRQQRTQPDSLPLVKSTRETELEDQRVTNPPLDLRRKPFSKRGPATAKPDKPHGPRIRFHRVESTPSTPSSPSATHKIRQIKHDEQPQRLDTPRAEARRVEMPSFGVSAPQTPKDDAWGTHDARRRLAYSQLSQEVEQNAEERHSQRAQLLGVEHAPTGKQDEAQNKEQHGTTSEPIRSQTDTKVEAVVQQHGHEGSVEWLDTSNPALSGLQDKPASDKGQHSQKDKSDSEAVAQGVDPHEVETEGEAKLSARPQHELALQKKPSQDLKDNAQSQINKVNGDKKDLRVNHAQSTTQRQKAQVKSQSRSIEPRSDPEHDEVSGRRRAGGEQEFELQAAEDVSKTTPLEANVEPMSESGAMSESGTDIKLATQEHSNDEKPIQTSAPLHVESTLPIIQAERSSLLNANSQQATSNDMSVQTSIESATVAQASSNERVTDKTTLPQPASTQPITRPGFQQHSSQDAPSRDDPLAYRAWLQKELASIQSAPASVLPDAQTRSSQGYDDGGLLSPLGNAIIPVAAQKPPIEITQRSNVQKSSNTSEQPYLSNNKSSSRQGSSHMNAMKQSHGSRTLDTRSKQPQALDDNSETQQRPQRHLRSDPFSAPSSALHQNSTDPWGMSSRRELPGKAARDNVTTPKREVQHPGLEDQAPIRFPHAAMRKASAAQAPERLPPQHALSPMHASRGQMQGLPWDQLLSQSPTPDNLARPDVTSERRIQDQEPVAQSSGRPRPQQSDNSWGNAHGRAQSVGVQDLPDHSSEHQQNRAPAPVDLASRSGIGRQALPAGNSMQASASGSDTQASSWPHLRRKGAAVTEQSQTSSQSPFGEEHDLDTDWVNQRFEEHRRRRELQSTPIVPPVQPTQPVQPAQPVERSTSSFYSPQVQTSRPPAERVCGRCGEKGHSARQCAGATCRRCGEKGHISHNCPNPPNPFRRVQSGGPQQAEQPVGETDLPFSAKSKQEDRSWRAAEQGQTESRNDDRSRITHRHNSREDMRSIMLETRPAAPEPTLDEAEVRRRERRASKWAETEVDERAQRSKGGRRGREDDEEDDDEGGAARDEKNARKAARKRERERGRQEAAQLALEQGPTVRLPQFVSVATLAQALGVRYENFVKRLERLGYDDIFPGMVLNSEVSGMIAMEYNVEPIFDSAEDEAEERDLKALPPPENKDYLPARPPVVTIMGHVDHGKTTILDFLRKSSVAAGEAGGITQHIGAFSVPLTASGKAITFLDTPGHAAFLSMRQRGANVTDIVILVVAADDSVKPQTLEAIKHAKSAGVPIIVAINKVDKEEADVQRVKQDLARHDIDIEDYGGETQVVEVSGRTGQGMDSLEEAIISLSEILDHRAETQGAVEGWVLEATTKKSGRVATVLVRRGTLVPGTIIVAGRTWARVRTLKNEGGQLIDEVGPGMPVEVDGWRDQPSAGDEVLQAPSEQKANDAVEYRTEMMEREKTAQDTDVINQVRRSEQQRKRAEALSAWSVEEPEEIEDFEEDSSTDSSGQILVPFIIKADVSGSAEAVTDYIQSIASPLIAPKILATEVGQIHESDIDRAAAAKGYIIAFNLPLDENMRGMAAHAGVEILENNIIYRVQEDVKSLFEDKLPAIVSQKVIGEAEISASFDIGIGGRKTMKIAGCKIRNGTVNRGSRVRVLRKGEKIYDGMLFGFLTYVLHVSFQLANIVVRDIGVLASLKNVKKDVQEMRKGTECGMSFDDWAEFEVGDQVQMYSEVSEKRKL